MEPNSQNDNLEELFRRSFGSSRNGVAGEGWNSPPPETWGNIRAGIALAPVPFWQSSRPWKWGSLVAALLLVWLSVQLLSYRSTIDTLTEKIARHEVLMDDLHTELHTQQNPIRLSPQEGASKREAVLEEIPTVPAPVNELNLTQAAPSAVRKPVFYEPVKEMAGIDLLPETRYPENGQSGNSILANEVMTQRMALFPIRNGGNADLLGSEIRVPSRTDKLVPIVANVPGINKRNGYYLGIVAAPIWITQMRNGHGPSNNPPKIQNRNGWSVGLKAGKEIGYNWSLESGLQLSAHYVNSIQNHKIKFSRNEEMPNQAGEYESNYRVNLAAGSEQIDTEVTFTRPESVQPEEGERIELDFHITEITNYLDVPIVSRYVFKSGRLNLAFRIGVLNRLKLSHYFSVDGVNIGNEKFHPSMASPQGPHGRRRRVSTNLKICSLHAVAGLGASYRLSDVWQVSLEPIVVRSITPIGTSGPQERISIEQESFSLNTSLEYRF